MPAHHEVGANDAPATFTCQICFDDKPFQECCFLACGHNQYCRECLNGMYTTAAQENNLAQMRCPHPACAEGQLTEQDVWDITQGNRELVQRFTDRLAAEHINQDRTIRHCQTVNCRYAFINEDGIANAMRCPSCNDVYCSNCLHPHPTNTTCAAAAEQRALTAPDAAARIDAEWLAQNTRDCPRCNHRIYKYEGCHKVTCRCRHEFCWNCLADCYNYAHTGPCRPIHRNPNIQIPVGPAIPRVGVAIIPLPAANPVAAQAAPELRQRAYQQPQPPMGHPANPQGQQVPNFHQPAWQQQPQFRRNDNREAATVFALIAATSTYFVGKYLWNKFKKPSQETTTQELPVFDEDFLNDTQAPASTEQEWLHEQTTKVSLEDDWDL